MGEDVQGLGLPAGAVEGQHLQLVGAFSHGLLGDQLGQGADGACVVARLDICCCQVFDCLQAQLLQADALGFEAVDARQRSAVPEV
ncbi:hypothetical protein OHS58_05640 [Amycolatopsis sp. NBC_00348]